MPASVTRIPGAHLAITAVSEREMNDEGFGKLDVPFVLG
jgi:hypothetical protein